MRLPDWVLQVLRQAGRQLAERPEKFSGNVQVNALEGGVTNVNVQVSVRVREEDVKS